MRVLEDVSPENARILFPSGKVDIVNKSRLAKFAVDRDLGSGGDSENVSLFPGAPGTSTGATLTASTATHEDRQSDSETEPAEVAQPSPSTSTPMPAAGMTSPPRRRGERLRHPALRFDSTDWRDPALL